jgi:hypothetical protein
MFKRVLVAATVVAAFIASSAAADSQRVTQGDATAVLEAFGNGGWSILNHATVVEGAPADGLVGGLATIRPFKFFNRKHYCALDWHVLVLADIEGGDSSFKQTEAAAIISGLSVEFTIDDAPVTTTQTAIKAFLNPGFFGLETAYYTQWGSVLAPTDLKPGTHTVSAVQLDAGAVVFKSKISIVIDPAGTGVCL